MLKEDLTCIVICLIGVVLFLYGANYFDVAVGWAGVSLALSGVVVEAVLTTVKHVRKRGKRLEAVEL